MAMVGICGQGCVFVVAILQQYSLKPVSRPLELAIVKVVLRFAWYKVPFLSTIGWQKLALFLINWCAPISDLLRRIHPILSILWPRGVKIFRPKIFAQLAHAKSGKIRYQIHTLFLWMAKNTFWLGAEKTLWEIPYGPWTYLRTIGVFDLVFIFA